MPQLERDGALRNVLMGVGVWVIWLMLVLMLVLRYLIRVGLEEEKGYSDASHMCRIERNGS
jgi:hypothetical protein